MEMVGQIGGRKRTSVNCSWEGSQTGCYNWHLRRIYAAPRDEDPTNLNAKIGITNLHGMKYELLGLQGWASCFIDKNLMVRTHHVRHVSCWLFFSRSAKSVLPPNIFVMMSTLVIGIPTIKKNNLRSI